MNIPQTWMLENVFQGGSNSPEFANFLDNLSQEISNFQFSGKIREPILKLQDLDQRFEEASSFAACLLAQNVHDFHAEILQSKLEECKAALSNISDRLDRQLGAMSEIEFGELIQELSDYAFPLNERRRLIKQRLNQEMEVLINDLSIDGYHSWSQLYGSNIGQEKIIVEADGKKEILSWGQAYNKLSSPSRSLRKAVFDSSNRTWEEHQATYSQILNHIAGFRLKVYQHRGWNFLQEPLEMNRMSMETLDAMWTAIDNSKAIFIDYMKRKAELMSLEKLSWYDQEAPLDAANAMDAIPYDEAFQFIVDQFKVYSPRMASFAEKAFQKRWIEAEDRPGKRPGGFCTGFPIRKESRIFMTYSGTNESLFTLAHELGHAFHNEIMYELPGMLRHYPMNLAETASTFAEMVVSEAALQKQSHPQLRKAMLNAKLQRAIIFFCNIRARFLFETRFYEERKKGSLSPEQLCGIMSEAQREAYGGALDELHPYFWASKVHFNLTDIPFYNFPYTFGYLFSTAIYYKARKDPSSFEEMYIALLKDTGSMTSECLAEKHLDADLTSTDFWKCAIQFLKEDAVEFLRL